MYLALMLDDEHYTDLYYESCETEVEGFDIFKKWNNEDYGEYYEEGNRFVWQTISKQRFAVCEVYELNDKPYVLIWWHAYNGVGFSVKQFDTFEEANAAMRAEADNIYIDEANVEACANEPITSDDWSGIIDDGYEWNCWQIIERSEL